MNKIQEQINRFISQHPEYKGQDLDLNIYCDILQDGEIIATSNLPHDLTGIKGQVATYWTIEKGTK